MTLLRGTTSVPASNVAHPLLRAARAEGQPRTELSQPAEPHNGDDLDGSSANGPSSEPCPNCTNGTFTRRTGRLGWQVQQMRCAFCHGTGRINPEGDAA